MEEDHQNIKIVQSSVYYKAYTLLISENMWYDTNILKILETLKKLLQFPINTFEPILLINKGDISKEKKML